MKLCDFGLARLKNAAFVETVSNTAGTPAYQVRLLYVARMCGAQGVLRRQGG